MKKKVTNKTYRAGNKPKTFPVNNVVQDRKRNYLLLAVILLITVIAYLPVLQNSFVWDDEQYITNNPLIHSINLKEIFSKNVMGNYHPVTILLLAIEYHFFGLHPEGFHLMNLFIHLLNVILVFRIVLFLSENSRVSLVTALLFGIHPMHVESVAWIAELKDLLYTFFFLTSWLCYLKYQNNSRSTFYILSLFLFLLSLLSKAMAVSLPLVFILTDYFKGRKITVKTIFEKAPFFLIAIVFGVVAIFAQKSGTVMDETVFTFPQRIVYASYGFITYLAKLVLPINLSSFYPYPVKNGMDVPVYYYLYLILFALLIAGIFYSLRVTKKIAFSIGFFAVTVFLVLQLLPVGSAIMADRYSYIPSIGIFYLAGEGFNLLWNKKMKWIAITLISIFGSFFLFKTYKRCTVWKNEMSLWDNVINQYQNIPVAYNNRGNAFRNNNKIKEAFEDYSSAIKLNPDYSTAYFNRGSIYMNEQKDAEALSDFNKAIELDPVYVKALSNRSIIYLNTKKYDEALYDLNKAILISSNSEILYNNRGKVLMNKNMFDEAIKDFETAIKLKPDFAIAYNNLGFAFYNLKKYIEAISYYSKAIELKPDFAEAYYYRAFAIYFSGNKDAACKDLNKAASLNYQPAAEALLKNCK